MAKRERGKIISWLVDRQFGFLQPDFPLAGEQSQDVFFHFSQVRPRTMRREELGPAMAVEFELVKSPRGWRAIEITLVKTKDENHVR
jgi:cold shock CspA family protein